MGRCARTLCWRATCLLSIMCFSHHSSRCFVQYVVNSRALRYLCFLFLFITEQNVCFESLICAVLRSLMQVGLMISYVRLPRLCFPHSVLRNPVVKQTLSCVDVPTTFSFRWRRFCLYCKPLSCGSWLWPSSYSSRWVQKFFFWEQRSLPQEIRGFLDVVLVCYSALDGFFVVFLCIYRWGGDNQSSCFRSSCDALVLKILSDSLSVAMPTSRRCFLSCHHINVTKTFSSSGWCWKLLAIASPDTSETFLAAVQDWIGLHAFANTIREGLISLPCYSYCLCSGKD